MTKLVRVLKVVKERNTLLKYINETLKLSAGFERLFFFTLMFFIFSHIISCFWVIVAAFEDLSPETWIGRANLLDADDAEIYISALYFTIMTISTVGFGDINAYTAPE